jgi:hypothetical protein
LTLNSDVPPRAVSATALNSATTPSAAAVALFVWAVAAAISLANSRVTPATFSVSAVASAASEAAARATAAASSAGFDSSGRGTSTTFVPCMAGSEFTPVSAVTFSSSRTPCDEALISSRISFLRRFFSSSVIAISYSV